MPDDFFSQKVGNLDASVTRLIGAISDLPTSIRNSLFKEEKPGLLSRIFGGDEINKIDENSIFGKLQTFASSLDNHTAALRENTELIGLQILLSKDDLKTNEKTVIMKRIREIVLDESLNSPDTKNDEFKYAASSNATRVKVNGELVAAGLTLGKKEMKIR